MVARSFFFLFPSPHLLSFSSLSDSTCSFFSHLSFDVSHWFKEEKSSLRFFVTTWMIMIKPVSIRHRGAGLCLWRKKRKRGLKKKKKEWGQGSYRGCTVEVASGHFLPWVCVQDKNKAVGIMIVAMLPGCFFIPFRLPFQIVIKTLLLILTKMVSCYFSLTYHVVLTFLLFFFYATFIYLICICWSVSYNLGYFLSPSSLLFVFTPKRIKRL